MGTSLILLKKSLPPEGQDQQTPQMMTIVLLIPLVFLPNFFEIVHIEPTQVAQHTKMIAAKVFQFSFEP